MTPRPDISDEDLRQWEAEFSSVEKQDRPDILFGIAVLRALFPDYTPTDYKEAFIMGRWLYQELKSLGCDNLTAEKIMFASGQKAAADIDNDPWRIAFETLEDYKKGLWDPPGPVLAENLFLKQMKALTTRFGQPSQEAHVKAQEILAGRNRISEPSLPEHLR